jgi:MFS family permease
LTLWRDSDFRKLWIGQSISEIGSRITRDGLPLAAVITLRASPFQMALLTAVSAGATLAFSLFAGVWVDRIRRRPVLIASDIGRALVIGMIPVTAYFGVLRISHLYVVAAVAGVLTVLFDVGYQSYVPTLVTRERIVEANSRLSLSGSVAEVIGPGLTGVLVQTLTAPIAILFDALSFFASALSVALIRKPELPTASVTAAPDMVEEIRAGFRGVAHQPVLAALAARAATASFCHGLIGPLYTLYAIRDLGMNPVTLGLVITVGGVSNLIGALSAPWVARKLGLGATFIGSAIVYAAAVMLIPAARPPLPLAIACLAGAQLLGDSFGVIYNVHETSLRQAITPDHLLGRVNSVMQLLTRGIWPIGAIAGGLLAQATSARTTLWVAALGLLASSLWLFGRPVRELTHIGASSATIRD